MLTTPAPLNATPARRFGPLFEALVVALSLLMPTAVSMIALSAPAARAQPQAPSTARQFPENTKAGLLQVTTFPSALLDGRAVTLAPGTRFFNRTNSPVLPQEISRPVRVRYQLDGLGQINRVWLLTHEESVAAGMSNWRSRFEEGSNP